MKSAIFWLALFGCPPAQDADTAEDSSIDTAETDETDVVPDCIPLANEEDCATAEDDDCSGSTNDEGSIGCESWFEDGDGDGFGAGTEHCTCTVPDISASNNTDCDDDNEDISPGAAEVCNAADDDCNELIDDDAIDPSPYYLDNDGDSYGASEIAGEDCAVPEGYSSDNTDCDDSNAERHPNRDEACDGVDNDCSDMTADEDFFSLYTDDTWAEWVLSSNRLGDLIETIEFDGSGAIRVCPGTYDEPINEFGLTSPLIIESVAGSSTTFWSVDEAFHVNTAPRLSVTGITFTAAAGPAISAYNMDAFTGEDLVFSGNYAAEDSYDTTAIVAGEVGTFDLHDFEITNNESALDTAGITLNGVEAATLSNGVFSFNEGNTPPLYVSHTDDGTGTLMVSDVDFDENVKGAAYFYGLQQVDLERVNLVGNANTNGKTVEVSNVATFSYTDGTVQGNNASSGIVYLFEGETAVFNQVSFETNAGAAIHISQVDDLQATEVGVSDSSATYGAALDAYHVVNADIDGLTCTDNSASWGGCIYASDSHLDVTNGSFTGNYTTSYAGAIYLSNASASISNSHINDNATNGAGGAAHLANASVVVENSEFLRNSGTTSGIVTYGGSTLESINSDWGEGADSNSPHDIYWSNATTYDFGTAANFTCTTNCQ